MASIPPFHQADIAPSQTRPRSISLNNDIFSGTPRLDPIIEYVQSHHGEMHRPVSSTNISFKGQPQEPNMSAVRLKLGSRKSSRSSRKLSPPPARFTEHVSFDNFASVEPTTRNTISFTLNAKHKGYNLKRYSRTFLVGIDENSYSDIALQWTLEELVDDGDEIICLRVIDKDAKITTDRSVERKQYQEEAKELMDSIQKRNDGNLAISLVLEFAVGKVHTTFQRMIQIYEPAMLIVGTRGRSLGGFQGLVSNRNSFSKWCLQYSPIPVVVVRSTEQRIRKKLKRDANPNRQDYVRILKESGIENHETTLAGSGLHIVETSHDQRTEAIAVADALGLPALFKPSRLEDWDGLKQLKKVDSNKSESTNGFGSRPSTPDPVIKSRRASNLDSPALSGDEDSEGDDDEEEVEFEAIPGHVMLEVERQRLHEMEVGEAAALKKLSIGSLDSNGSGSVEEEDERKPEMGNG